jgi:DNA repair photolyase
VTNDPLTVDAGPRNLPYLPEPAKAALDPYMALIVGYRKSGLSLNHIVGCPLDCGYCVRHFWGNFEVKVPHLLCSTDEAIEKLITHPAFRPQVTPVQLFNKATDPFLPGVKPHLFDVLEALDQRGYTNHALVITRFHVSDTDMARLEQLRHLRVTLLLTYSGISDPRVEPIAKTDTTVRSIRTAIQHKRRTGVVLYWRPIVPNWNDSPDTMSRVLETSEGADAIVFTGYYHKSHNAEYLRSLGVDVPYDDGYARRKIMPDELDARVVAAWKASGTTTPLFRKTSCGVAYAHHSPDYNGHWGVRELCDICPTAQRRRCADDYAEPTAAQIDAVLAQLGYESDYLIEPGHVWTHGLGEQRRYAVQHALRHQIWELDQPHHLHAHGRSLLGHTPDPEQADAFAAVRRHFEQTARHDDE